jgi:hypothetical protein
MPVGRVLKRSMAQEGEASAPPRDRLKGLPFLPFPLAYRVLTRCRSWLTT